MELCNYPSAQKCRFYEIEAIEIPIVYNKYGDHDPNGLLYVLKKDAKKVREARGMPTRRVLTPSRISQFYQWHLWRDTAAAAIGRTGCRRKRHHRAAGSKMISELFSENGIP